MQDREAIAMTIAADNPRAAARMDSLFEAAAARVAAFPGSGRPGRLPGTRESVAHENYVLVYELDGDLVSIRTVLHTSRQWPPVRD
jgi:addiction module RelE/StbE family toxin